MSLTIDGQANSIASSTGGVNIPATVGTLSVGPSGSYMNVTSSGTNIGPNGSYITANSSGIGIGTNNPQTSLHLKTNGGAIALIESNTNYDGNIRVKNTGAYYTIGMLGSPGSTSLSFYDNNAEASRMSIDTSGRVTMPSQPAFIATKDSSQTLTQSIENLIVFGTEVIDIGSHYSSNRFTAPVTGVYQFQFSCMGNSSNAGYVRFALKKNGASFYGLTYATITTNAYESIVSSSLVNLSTNDYVEVNVYPTMTSFVLDNTGTFSGCLVG